MRLLDLFCGAGGAAMGYSRAGFTEIVGVDIAPQPRYPFTFVQADALEYVREHGHEYDAIHASPPCQGYSPLTRTNGHRYPLLLPSVLSALDTNARPYVVENLVHAPFSGYRIRLCGLSFGLRLQRHRLFGSNVCLLAPSHPPHRPGMALRREIVTVAGGFGGSSNANKPGGHPYKRASRSEAEAAMEIDWMAERELMEAIPPAYTEFIGRQLLRALTAPVPSPSVDAASSGAADGARSAP